MTKTYRNYLRLISACYAGGAFLHFLDLLNLRLNFSGMTIIWKAWTVYLLLFDSLAALGLWKGKSWGVGLFLLIASSQLVAYAGFQPIFGSQPSLVTFHLLTLSACLYLRQRKPGNAASY